MASCGGTTSDSAAPRPDVFDLAIAVPADTPSLHVPNAWIEGTGAARGCIPGGAMGPATCASMHVDGDRLIVSFTLGARADDQVVSAGSATVLVHRVAGRARDRLRSEAEVQQFFPRWQVVRREPVAGGYALALLEPLALPGFHVMSRLPIAGDDFWCSSHRLGRMSTRDEAMTELDLCLALRAPLDP